MIDIVIPLRNDSHWQNNEIRYCLRSVEMYLKDIRNVYIVGYKPKFIHNVIHIPTNDPHPWVTFNIRDKLIRACNEVDLSDNFLFMNDDHYIMRSFDQNVYYHHGPIESILKTSHNSIYRRIAQNTIERLGQLRENWDVHTPVMMNKDLVRPALMQHPWPNTPDYWGGYLIKSLYCDHFFSSYINRNSVKIEYVADAKIREPLAPSVLKSLSEEVPVISSGDKVYDGLQRLLNNLFPNKSKYEL